MIEVEDCLDEINRLQLNFHSSVVNEMEQNELLKLAKEWQNQFKYWALSDFKKVVDHIIKNNKYFPKSSEFWTLKKEIIEKDKGKIKKIFNCGYCKDTGIRAYKDKNGIIHICRCDCMNCYKYLPFMSEIKYQGSSEYLIHDVENPFAFIPHGEGFRLSKEIAGHNKTMIEILNKAEKRIGQDIIETVQPEFEKKYEDEELPF